MTGRGEPGGAAAGAAVPAAPATLPATLSAVLGREGPVCVSLSGGVDSSVVLAAAVAVFGPGQVTALTADSPTFIAGELAAARRLCADLGVRHLVVQTTELDDERFVANPPDRCYRCKAGLLGALGTAADELGCVALFDGVNADDPADHRPGLRAADERGVRHPLLEAGLGKQAVRALARELGLAAWDRPADACLASRIPYGERITAEKLRAVAAAEADLHRLGFAECRVRHHGTVARVELPVADLPRATGKVRPRLVAAVAAAGFAYVALDLQGFRSGSLNEVLDRDAL